MRRLTLNMALGSLLVAAMSLSSTEATAQSRGERNGRGRVESSQRSSASRSQSTRSSESRMERGSSRSNANATTINRSEVRSNRSEASNWPKTNRNNATVNTDRDNRRDQSASQSRRNGIGRTFDSRKENANNNNGDGNHSGNNNGGYRPGGNNNGDGNHNGNNNGGYRPGGNHNGGKHNDGGYRPGGNHGGNNNGGYRPGGNNHGGNHNGGGYRPGGNHNGYKPGPGNFHPGVNRPHDHHGMIVHRPHSWVTPVAPPIRHFRPHHHHIIRPVIPVGYHPWHRAPVIRGILGLTFGTAYYASLDYLYDRGYEIDGYYDGIVYLRNVIEMRVTWPDVMLNYGSLNALNSAEFHYSTSFDDLGRFNFVHRELCNRYGSPMSYDESRSGIQAVWYGGNATGYVTLEYFYQNGRYYTTLSYSH